MTLLHATCAVEANGDTTQLDVHSICFYNLIIMLLCIMRVGCLNLFL